MSATASITMLNPRVEMNQPMLASRRAKNGLTTSLSSIRLIRATIATTATNATM